MLELVGRMPIAEELRSREPNEQDLKNIKELRGLGWGATAIASAIEMDVRIIRKVIKTMPRPAKETPAQRIDRVMVGRVR